MLFLQKIVQCDPSAVREALHNYTLRHDYCHHSRIVVVEFHDRVMRPAGFDGKFQRLYEQPDECPAGYRLHHHHRYERSSGVKNWMIYRERIVAQA